MDLKFPPHSQTRLYGRDINVNHIKKAISEPDYKREVFGGRTLVQKKVDAGIIEVVYYKNEFSGKKERYIIITAYYL